MSLGAHRLHSVKRQRLISVASDTDALQRQAILPTPGGIGDRCSLFYDSSMWRVILVLLWIFCGSAVAGVPAKAERQVVVVVWDGMRPDFVSEQNTPTLWKFARDGVTFRNHHAVYPSATMVNGTAMVTGVYPGKNGIIANHAYRPTSILTMQSTSNWHRS